MAQSEGGRLETASVPTLGWVAVGLAVVTGVLHLYAGAVEGRLPVLLAGLGFLVAVVLYLVDYRRRQLYLAGVVYTAVQLPLWYVVKAGEYTVVGYVDKTVQVLLIATLAVLYWRARTASS
ncbi:MAG: hypothetical protein ABEJ92_05485 [Halobacteriales archaeon]